MAMATGNFVAYYRVSTTKQGQSGLGLDVQRQAVADFLNGGRWKLLHEFTEIESGKRNDRPQLVAALAYAKATGSTLVIAKLDRLARNVAFIANLMESGGAKFVAADMPTANELTIHVLAAVAEHERKAISQRTKDALAAAKARGTKLGNPNGARALRVAARGNVDGIAAAKAKADAHAAEIRPIIAAIKADGFTSLREIAKELNARNILTARGGAWYATTVRNLLAR